jgi:hypothetical protein
MKLYIYIYISVFFTTSFAYPNKLDETIVPKKNLDKTIIQIIKKLKMKFFIP